MNIAGLTVENSFRPSITVPDLKISGVIAKGWHRDILVANHWLRSRERLLQLVAFDLGENRTSSDGSLCL